MNAISTEMQPEAASNQPLSSVLYRSSAAISPEALRSSGAVDEFAARNRKFGLTGYMHFEDGLFYQYLEGPARALSSAWAAIRRDARHEDIVELSHVPIPARRFPRWSMGYSDGGDGSLFDWAARSGMSLKGRHAASALTAFLEYVSRPAVR